MPPTGPAPPVACSACGLRLNLAGARPGRRGRCPSCGAEFRVPGAAAPTPTLAPSTLPAPPPAPVPIPIEPEVNPDRPGRGRSAFVARGREARSAPMTLGGVVEAPRQAGGLRRSLLYPLWDLSGIGWLVLASTLLTPPSLAVFSLVAVMRAGGLFVGGVLGLIGVASLFVVGYALAFLSSVAAESATGAVAHPRWPGFEAFETLGALVPWASALVLSAPLVLPALRLPDLLVADPKPIQRLLAASAALALLAGYPMVALLANLLHGDPTAARPWVVLPALIRLGPDLVGPWLLGSASLGLAIGVIAAIHQLESAVAVIPAAWLAWFAVLYSTMAALHALGSAYHRRAASVGWFPDRPRWGVRH